MKMTKKDKKNTGDMVLGLYQCKSNEYDGINML